MDSKDSVVDNYRYGHIIGQWAMRESTPYQDISRRRRQLAVPAISMFVFFARTDL